MKCPWSDNECFICLPHCSNMKCPECLNEAKEIEVMIFHIIVHQLCMFREPPIYYYRDMAREVALWVLPKNTV